MKKKKSEWKYECKKYAYKNESKINILSSYLLNKKKILKIRLQVKTFLDAV